MAAMALEGVSHQASSVNLSSEIGGPNFRKRYALRLVGALNVLNKPTASNIKLAADVSFALTVNRAAWRSPRLNEICSRENNKHVLRKILRPKKLEALIAQRARCHSRLIMQPKLKRIHLYPQMNWLLATQLEVLEDLVNSIRNKQSPL